MCAWYPPRQGEGAESLGTRVTDSCELPCAGWESNPGLPEEQPVFLTAELFVQPLGLLLLCRSHSCLVASSNLSLFEDEVCFPSELSTFAVA